MLVHLRELYKSIFFQVNNRLVSKIFPPIAGMTFIDFLKRKINFAENTFIKNKPQRMNTSKDLNFIEKYKIKFRSKFKWCSIDENDKKQKQSSG